MSDPLIRACDHYVVLEPAGAERLLTAAETLDWLVAQLEALEEVPADLASLPDAPSRALRLLAAEQDKRLRRNGSARQGLLDPPLGRPRSRSVQGLGAGAVGVD